MKILADLNDGGILSRGRDFRRGLVLHAFSQTCYIISSFYLFAQKRPVVWWLTLVAVITFYYGVHLYLIRKRTKEWIVWPLVGVGISNSVFINLESNSLWVYLLAGIIGVSAISFFVDNRGRHAFNASAVGGLITIALLPSVATATSWSQPIWFYGLILFLGNATSFVSRRWILSWAYLFGFIFSSVIAHYAFSLSGESNLGLSVLFWPSVLFTPGTLIWAFHVITDPATSPSSGRGQIIFGLSVGALDFFLRGFMHFLLSDFISYAFVQLIYWYGSSHFSRTLGAERASHGQLACVRHFEK